MTTRLPRGIALGSLMFALLCGAAAAQTREIDNIIVDQNRVVRTYSTPLSTPGTLGLGYKVDDLTAEPGAEETIFTLRRIELIGGENGPLGELPELWQDRLGTTMSVAELAAITKAIDGTYYRGDLFAHAIVRSVAPDDGVVVIEIFEGYLEEIIVISDDPELEPRLRPYIDRIAALVPLRVSLLERNLLLMADLDGHTVDALLERLPGGRGAGRLTLTIDPESPSGVIQLNNLGSPETGPLQATGVATFGDLLGLFEQTSFVGVVNPVAPREFAYLNLSQSVPVGTYGLRAGYAVAGISSKPGGDLANLDVEVRSANATLSLDYPFIRRISHNLNGGMELHLQNQTVEVGPVTAVEDRSRWITLRADADRNFDAGDWSALFTASQGLSGLGASSGNRPQAGRFGGDANFRMVTGELGIGLALAESLSLNIDVAGQYAFDPLPDAVRFSVGGDPFGRAFAGLSVAGDSGYGGSAELERAFDAGIDWVPYTAAFVFADHGYVHNRAVGTGFTNASLGSVGGGLRMVLANGIFAEGSVAVPIQSSAAVEDRGTRYHFTLAFSF